MAKQRFNFTMEPSVKRRLNQLSKESYRYVGRSLSQSEVIEFLINKAFVDKKELLQRQYDRYNMSIANI